MAYAAVVTLILLRVLDSTLGLRVDSKEEEAGVENRIAQNFGLSEIDTLPLPVAEEIELNIEQPYIEIIEILKDSVFIAKKTIIKSSRKL